MRACVPSVVRDVAVTCSSLKCATGPVAGVIHTECAHALYLQTEQVRELRERVVVQAGKYVPRQIPATQCRVTLACRLLSAFGVTLRYMTPFSSLLRYQRVAA
jgi:hypothetical protein